MWDQDIFPGQCVTCGLKNPWFLCRSLVWEGDWRTDIFMASLKEMDKGNSVKLVLTVNGQVKEVTSSSFLPWVPNVVTSELQNFLSHPFLFLLFATPRQSCQMQIC